MATLFTLFRGSTYHGRSSGVPERKARTRCLSLRRISRRLWRNPKMFYAIAGLLSLAIFCGDLVFNSSVFYTPFHTLRSDQNAYPSSDLNQSEDPLTSPPRYPQGAGTERPKGFTAGISKKEKLEKTHDSRSAGPPSYLPLAQHLKYVNYTRAGSSLRDMVFGAQKRTYPDLEPTNNFDLLNCRQCSQNSKALGLDKAYFDHRLQLARLAVRILTFYKFSSMLVLPCVDEIHWILPLNAAIRKFSPTFKTHCAVASVKDVVHLMKKYSQRLLAGCEFVVYRPMNEGNLPTADVMFSWRGLEQYDLEDIEEVFKDAVKENITHLLVGNSPGYENAKVVETSIGTFSIKRPEVPGLNVRAYPFGFNEAERVFSLLGKQLLFYNTSNMRDGW